MTTRTAPRPAPTVPTAEQLEAARAAVRHALATDPILRRAVRATRRTRHAVDDATALARSRRAAMILGRPTRLEV